MIQKINMVSKTQSWMLISNPLKNYRKKLKRTKVFNKKVSEKCSFFTFITACKSFYLILFWVRTKTAQDNKKRIL
jgi:hypothetical protein